MRDKNTTQGNKTMTRIQLVSAFLTNAIVNHMGSKWTVEGLLREDGSGFCFIVTLQNVKTGERRNTFIRTFEDGRIGHPEHTLSHAYGTDDYLNENYDGYADPNGHNVAFPV